MKSAEPVSNHCQPWRVLDSYSLLFVRHFRDYRVSRSDTPGTDRVAFQLWTKDRVTAVLETLLIYGLNIYFSLLAWMAFIHFSIIFIFFFFSISFFYFFFLILFLPSPDPRRYRQSRCEPSITHDESTYTQVGSDILFKGRI